MQRHIISSDSTLLLALEKLNRLSGGAMTLFVTGTNGMLVGTLTDGDIRRGMLRGARPETKVTEVMNRSFAALQEPLIDLEKLKQWRRKGLRLIPVVDASMHISRIIDTTQTRTLLPMTAILMGGGRGERLRPLTLTCPKPLLDVGGHPIIDHNIHALASVGISDIYVTVNYMADAMESHFSRPVAGVNVTCVREPFPMGTLGSAALVPLPEEGHTLVMNSDLLTSLSFEEMYLSHIARHADITIAAIPYNVSVPYAILTLKGNAVTDIHEKPSYAYYANAGIYIISNRLLRSLPRQGRTDAPDFIREAIDKGLRVTYYPITGTWIDIGTPTDYARACEIMGHRTLSDSTLL